MRYKYFSDGGRTKTKMQTQFCYTKLLSLSWLLRLLRYIAFVIVKSLEPVKRFEETTERLQIVMHTVFQLDETPLDRAR